MSHSRRSLLAAGAGIASVEVARAAGGAALAGTASDSSAQVVEDLARGSAEANAALMRGEGERYFAMVDITDDFTLMSPFGGTPSRSPHYTREEIIEIGRFFRNGTFAMDLVQSYASPDMVVLAVIERAHVEVGGLPAQEWALRVTLVYRREGSRWRLAHRHADPLAPGVSVAQAAALARGEPDAV